MFNWSFYDQKDKVSMEIPFVPVLVNLFKGHHQNSWREEFVKGEVFLYNMLMLSFIYLKMKQGLIFVCMNI